MAKRKYNIENRTMRTQYVLLEAQVAWLKRNFNAEEYKNESEFVRHLLSLGIKEYTTQKAGNQLAQEG